MAENEKKSNYDSSKNRIIWEEDVSIDDKNSLKIGKYSYNNGPEKFGISRIWKGINREGVEAVYYNQFGRFTLEEYTIIMQVINEKEGL